MQSNNNDNYGIRINYNDDNAKNILSKYISRNIKEKTIIVCIGTDKCIGDCLGPIVGTLLQKNNYPFPVIGSLENPTHAMNLDTVVKNIKNLYSDYYTIAVDACLGSSECLGDIQVKHGPVHPGKGVGKKLPKVGNISIVGVVDTIDNSDLFSMRNIRLNFILKMANIIASSLLMSIPKKIEGV